MRWVIFAGVGLLVAGVVAITLWLRRRRADRPLVSIVMMREKPRNLSDADVRGAARRAIGSDVNVTPLPTPNLPDARGWVVHLGEIPAFLVIDAQRAYTSDPEGDANSFEHPDARRAFASHRAWVSTDVFRQPPRELREQVLAVMGRLAAELIDDGTTLVYAPALRRFALPGEQTEATLRGGDPMTLFSDAEVNTPVIHVEAGDRKIERAMAEAREKWPRFLEGWRAGDPENSAIAKGAFRKGDDYEYLWMEVVEADEHSVTGVIVNEPHTVDIKKGQKVRIAVKDVADWACMIDGKPEGMFVERILHSR